MSLINVFSLEELYTPDFLDNTGYLQEPNPYEAMGEQIATSPTKKKKATHNRKKSSIQTDNAPRQTAWTTEEEIALAKEIKTKLEGRRTYDMVVGKWKTVRPAVVRFCGVYSNVMRMARESGAGDEDYVQKAMIHYQAETELPFKFRHYWDSGDASINLNNTVAGDDEVVNEMTAAEVEQREAFIELKKREVECRKQEIAATEYRAQQEDMKLYLQPYDHLTGDQRLAWDEIRAKIKAKYNLQF
ncbi:hypothetical protein Tco_0508629 [Tanacetum coccineum]